MKEKRKQRMQCFFDRKSMSLLEFIFENLIKEKKEQRKKKGIFKKASSISRRNVSERIEI